MANRNARAKIRALRKAKEHFHGQACDTASKGQPRDKDRKLLEMGKKRADAMKVNLHPKTW